MSSSIRHRDGIRACKKCLENRTLLTNSSEDICQFILERNVYMCEQNF